MLSWLRTVVATCSMQRMILERLWSSGPLPLVACVRRRIRGSYRSMAKRSSFSLGVSRLGFFCLNFFGASLFIWDFEFTSRFVIGYWVGLLLPVFTHLFIPYSFLFASFNHIQEGRSQNKTDSYWRYSKPFSDRCIHDSWSGLIDDLRIWIRALNSSLVSSPAETV